MNNTSISNIDDLNKIIENGDIIAFQGTTGGSWFIRIFTISKFSHVAIARREGVNAFIYEYPDTKSKIKKSNIFDRVNESHVKSVRIIKSNRKITDSQLNELDDDFQKRLLIDSKYSKIKAVESGLTKFVVFMSFVFLLISLAVQILNMFFMNGRLPLELTLIGFIFPIFLMPLVWVKPKKFLNWLEKNQENKVGFDFCSGYVVTADHILGGDIYKHKFLESNLTPKNVVSKAKQLGYTSYTYKKN